VLDVHGKSGHTVHPQKHCAAWTSNDTQKTSLRVFESLNNTWKTLCCVFKSSVDNPETSRHVKNRHGEAATRSIRGRSVGSFLCVWIYTRWAAENDTEKKPVPSYVKFGKCWIYVSDKDLEGDDRCLFISYFFSIRFGRQENHTGRKGSKATVIRTGYLQAYTSRVLPPH
jgi:hypothetical protein